MIHRMVNDRSTRLPCSRRKQTIAGHRSRHVRRGGNPGVAAVEMAVCLPVIILLVFGAIEASSFIFLKQSLHVAAYEGIRESIRVGSSSEDGIERAANILRSRDVQGFEIRFPGGDAADAERGDEIVVEVSAPTSKNSPLAGQFVTNRTLTARVVMVKE